MVQEKIYKKGEIIFSDSLGVCMVAEVSSLTGKSNSYQYYRIESIFDNKKFCYLPTTNHQMQLRDVLTKERAKELRQSSYFEKMNDIEKQEIEYVLSQK